MTQTVFARAVRETVAAAGWPAPHRLLRSLYEVRRLRRRLRALRTRVARSGSAGEVGPASVGFHLVHYEAVDFLTLAVRSIRRHHPDAPITVLDNGSAVPTRRRLARALADVEGTTVLLADVDKPRHTVALQVLLDRAAAAGDRAAVFLDQDCVLLAPLDDLLGRLGSEVAVLAAPDAVRIPRSDGPLAAGWMRAAHALAHPSFLLVAPAALAAVAGPLAFAEHPAAADRARREGYTYEPYHGLSLRTGRHLALIEATMDADLPPLTWYRQAGTTYAAHAWYSARTHDLPDDAVVDGSLPVRWVRARRAAILERLDALVTGAG